MIGTVMEVNTMCENIQVEQSCITLQSHVDTTAYFESQSLNCEGCDFLTSKGLHPNGERNITIDFASFGTVWKVIDKDNVTLCSQQDYYFEDGATYRLFFNKSDCILTLEKKGPSVYMPLVVAAIVYFLLAVFFILGKYLYRMKIWNRLITSRGSFDELAASYSGSSCIEESKHHQVKNRLRSLDTVRGVAIVMMIFVNYGGGRYWFFDHAFWNGLTVADLVFPWFIWMMGMSLALSSRSLLRKAISRKKIFMKILKRSVVLFVIGLMLNTECLDIDLSHIRISGVLQRFSISYFVVATIHMYFARAEDIYEESSFSELRDIILYWGEWLIMLTILVIHFLLTFLVHAPECPSGYLGPGGMHDGGNYSSCTGGAAGYIDRKVLGENHLYQRPTIKLLYHTTLPYDPEGILGYLTSIFLVYLGLQAGKILLTYQSAKARIWRWLIWGLVTGIIAIILSEVAKIPINKNLWSVSFIFATGSLAFILMSICYYVIDQKHWWSGVPFFYSGMNSILLYVGHSVTHNMFPWSWNVESNHQDILAIDLWGTSLWVIISIWAYHVNFFVTV